MRETGIFGYVGRRSGVPAIVVVDPNGRELMLLPAERHGTAVLLEWDAEGQKSRKWPDEL